MLTLSLLVFSFGAVGFFYIKASSPLSLIDGSDRPVAAATLFVPRRSPFSFSLLTQPEKLVAFAQSLEAPEQRQQTLREIEQARQHLIETIGLDKIGLDYEQAIQPWLGEETTFAIVSADLDADGSNGEQPGYLIALEVAPNHQLEAREFLQLFWQQQALAGNVLGSEAISGVRILSTSPAGSQSTRATALVGGQFVLLANDVRVLRRGIQVAQTADNLAQTLAYRQAATDLPKQRIALARFDLDLLNDAGDDEASSSLNKSFTTVSIGLERTGLIASALVPPAQSALDQRENESVLGGKLAWTRGLTQPKQSTQPVEVLRLLPTDSDLAIASHNLPHLKSALITAGLSAEAMPALFRSVLSSSTLSPSQTGSSDDPWSWATSEYALARVGGRPQDWILAVERDQAGIAALDKRAIAAGYSQSAITIEDTTATVWSRLTTRRNTRKSASELETELLGLHMQRGRYEIFANSLATMVNVLTASEPAFNQDLPVQDSPAQDPPASTSLVQSAKFKQAITPLATPNQGYLYLDWPAIAPTLSRRFPLLNQVVALSAPLSAHIDTVAATRQDEIVNLFAHFEQ
ncbi:MAG: DUF3352 domain-containing protein [Cyanobacteria bacterium P01_D01_bin.1]